MTKPHANYPCASPSFDFENARRDLQECADELNRPIFKSGYTMAELQAIRTKLLKVVRENIDPHAFGHMPDERRY